jgi:hypothetical protein
LQEKKMKGIFNIGRAFLFAPVLFAFVFLTNTSSALAVTIYGVTNTNQLVRFDSATPGTVTTVGAITGLQASENILGIDFRPATGQLYALGSTSRIYVINAATGAATQVGSGPFAPVLSGTDFGFDFNPTVDRIRVVSNADQNLRLHPDTGAVVQADTPLNPPDPNVVGSAYTNNFVGATTTTLYGIDSNTDMLVLQGGLNGTPSPNGGVITNVGPLGVNASSVLGVDFTSANNTAYAALSVGGVSGLYTINLTTGAATSVGAFGGLSLTSLAVEIGSTPNLPVIGLTTNNSLVQFNSARPGAILRSTPITGLQSGESILGIDFRPANGRLYAVGSTSRIYVIDAFTGVATQVGAGPFTPALSGTDFGFDFNPAADRIRIVSNTNQNLRLNPDTGAVVMADTPLNGAATSADGAAYTNNFAGTTTTTLYDIDSNSDTLYLQGGLNGSPSPNGGVLTSVGPLGVNTTTSVGFDIATTSGAALASFQISGDPASKLFRINLNTGAAAYIGNIGGGTALRDIAVTFRTTVDFDGDRKTDFSIFRLSENNWYILNSSTNNSTFNVVTFGLAQNDILTPGDYDGDGKTDIAVWRDSNGINYILKSSDGMVLFIPFGVSGDEPVNRDYDGDGKTDIAVVRRQGGLLVWYVLQSSNGAANVIQFGLDTDFVAPADYDGDGRCDLAVQRGLPGQPATFYILQTSAGLRIQNFGFGDDFVVPGDYDGDGKADLAVYRLGAQNLWFVHRSSDNTGQAVQLGATEDSFAAQGDYDGDGKTDFAVWDRNTGVFSVIRSVNGSLIQQQFGLTGDYPVANFDVH